MLRTRREICSTTKRCAAASPATARGTNLEGSLLYWGAFKVLAAGGLVEVVLEAQNGRKISSPDVEFQAQLDSGTSGHGRRQGFLCSWAYFHDVVEAAE